MKHADQVVIQCGPWTENDGNRLFIQKRRIKTGATKVEPNFPGYDINDANEALQNLLRITAGIDPGIKCNGLRYKRVIAGTSTWSKHSPWRIFGCRCAAADLYFPLPLPTGVDMPRLDRVLAEQLRLAKQGKMPGLKKLILRNRYYDRDFGFQPRPYTGIYHYHIHIETDASGSVC
jgi:hypothetical protein